MNDKHNKLSDELLAAFLDGNVNAEEANQVLSSIGTDKELTEILSLSDEIDAETQKEEYQIIPMWALAAANPDNLCSLECEAFLLKRYDFDIDHFSLLETAKANNWIKEEGTPLHHVGRLLELKGLHVERKYDANVADIESALDAGFDVIAIVDRNILDGKNASTPLFHAILMTWVEEAEDNVEYLNLDGLADEDISCEDFMKAWKASSCYMVKVAQNKTAYNPQPINVDDICLDASLEELTEAIAENAHDIWARARMDEGWTYGHIRNDELKQHPDIVPYAQLPESEKEYDRIMAINTLRLVRRLGFKISK